MAELRAGVVIIGGGIAGLWTLARVIKEGWSAILLEHEALGHGQTIASQGIIHGGVKYALSGRAGKDSADIADMPARWEAAFDGRGEIDLSSTTILSPCQYLFTSEGVGSRLTALAASKVIRTRTDTIAPKDRPEVLRDAPERVGVYRVPEPVVDPVSLMNAFRTKLADHIARIDHTDGATSVEFTAGKNQVRCRVAGEPLTISATRIVLAAGEGNEPLLAQAGVNATRDAMQRRPLHMVMVRNVPGPLFAHGVGIATDVPRCTMTTGRDRLGRLIWWIGGGIAESGVDRSSEEQIEAARQELAKAMPWASLDALECATMRIDRAETRQPGQKRPSGPGIAQFENTMAIWPTKLALAPALADDVTKRLGEPPVEIAEGPLARNMPTPDVAQLPWNVEGLEWS